MNDEIDLVCYVNALFLLWAVYRWYIRTIYNKFNKNRARKQYALLDNKDLHVYFLSTYFFKQINTRNLDPYLDCFSFLFSTNACLDLFDFWLRNVNLNKSIFSQYHFISSCNTRLSAIFDRFANNSCCVHVKSFLSWDLLSKRFTNTRTQGNIHVWNNNKNNNVINNWNNRKGEKKTNRNGYWWGFVPDLSVTFAILSNLFSSLLTLNSHFNRWLPVCVHVICVINICTYVRYVLGTKQNQKWFDKLNNKKKLNFTNVMGNI